MGGNAMVGQVTSADGTSITYDVDGSGPITLFLHGLANDRTRWRPMLPVLTKELRVVTVDRRGRGDSGDTLPYALEREVEDLQALLALFKEPVHLVGHAFGAVCVLEALTRVPNVASAVLCRFPAPGGDGYCSSHVLEKILNALAVDDFARATRIYFGEVAHMPRDLIDEISRLPTWRNRLQAAHTIGRELLALEAFSYDKERLSKGSVPVMLLHGNDADASTETAMAALEATLPVVERFAMRAGQVAAMNTDIAAFTDPVVAWVKRHHKKT